MGMTQRINRPLLTAFSTALIGTGCATIPADETIRTELKPTGNPESPYVGILRYVEHVYECNGPSDRNCRRVSATPVTEIFRFRNGRWIY